MTPSRRPLPLCRALRSTLLALATLAAVHAPPARAGWLAGDPAYLGYRIPDHRWSYWTARTDFSGSHSAHPFGFSGMNRSGFVNASLGTRLGQGYDSDRLLHHWRFGADASGGRSGQHTEDRGPTSTLDSRRTDRSRYQRLELDGSVRVYPTLAPVGLFLFTGHALDLSQRFRDLDATQRDPSARTTIRDEDAVGSRRYVGWVSVGAGVGRVRDATPVYSAQVIEERLLREGSLTRPLAVETRRKLAALHEVRLDMGNAHQRPDKYFWRELERILREDGALAADALDAYDVFRLLEPITVGSPVARQVGFFAGPSVTVQTFRDHRTRETFRSVTYYLADTLFATSSSAFDGTFNDRRDDVSVAFGAEFHRPLGPRWQMDLNSQAAIREAGEFPRLTNLVALTYLVSDRWLANVRAFHDASAEGHSRRFDRWSVELSAQLVYFLEDTWALRLAASERQVHGFSGLNRDGSLSLGITYVISGLFEAPGLVRMVPTPPRP